MRERSRSRAAAGKPAGIREMAETLGVSIGTVDRALHDRPGISPATRALVLELAEKLGYRPNLAARLLSSRKQHRIAVLFPSEIAAFWDLVRDGVLDFAGTLRQAGVEAVYRPHGGLHEGDADVAQALEGGLPGPRAGARTARGRGAADRAGGTARGCRSCASTPTRPAASGCARSAWTRWRAVASRPS